MIDWGAIDYEKGCYVGQELIARTHYRGEIRKKLLHLKFPVSENIPSKNQKLFLEKEEVGEILSSSIHNNEIHALALVKTEKVKDPNDLRLTT